MSATSMQGLRLIWFDFSASSLKLVIWKPSTGSSLKYRKWPYQIKNEIWIAKIVIISIEFGPSRVESYDYHLFYHGFEPPGAFWNENMLCQFSQVWIFMNFHPPHSRTAPHELIPSQQFFFRTSPSSCLTSDHNRHLISRFIKRSQIRPVFDPLSPNRRHQRA